MLFCLRLLWTWWGQGLLGDNDSGAQRADLGLCLPHEFPVNLMTRSLGMPPFSHVLPLRQSVPGLSPQPEAKCLNEGSTHCQTSQ